MAEPTVKRHLLIHCGAGFSRSPAAVAVLLAQAAPAIAPGDIAAMTQRYVNDKVTLSTIGVGGDTDQATMGDLGPLGEAYASACNGDGPGPDTLIGACAAAVAVGELSDLEAFGIFLLLVSAGTESTTSLLGSGARLLAEDMVLQDRLREDPLLIPLQAITRN